MKCEFADSLLQGYFDGELSGRRTAEFERHLQHCAHCSAELVDLDMVSGMLRLTPLYQPAPVSLRRKIDAYLRPIEPAAPTSQPFPWQWLATAAALLLVAIVIWRVSPELRNDDYQAELAGEIVEAHLRALQPGHMNGVASANVGVVKEWFDAKIKFALPVRDFAKAGFALNGGRMDVIEGRSVAVLVYEHNGRPINVFIWATREPDTPPRAGYRQGFQWVDWRKDNMEFCAVSDADPADLGLLQQLINSSV